MLRSREVQARRSYECGTCGATIAGGEHHAYVVTTSPHDGFLYSRHCHTCAPAWAVEGRNIPLEPEPIDGLDWPHAEPEPCEVPF